MKRKSWTLGGVGVIAIAIAGTALVLTSGARGKSADASHKPAAEAPLEFQPREVVQPVLARLPLRIEFSGPLIAPSTAVVHARAAGTLLALDVAEGSHVQAGQVLGRLDLSELSGHVAERDADLASAKAQLAQAERTHASNLRLADQHFISSSALDASQASLDTARARVRAAEAQLDTTRIALRDAALVAPIPGVVAKRQVVPGEKLSAEQPLLSIVDLRVLELEGSVGTHEVSQLAPGMPAEVRVEGVEQPVQGRIARIAPAAEPGTRSIGVTIRLDNPKELFRAGQYAVASVLLHDGAPRLTLPIAAIGSNAGQDHVWVIDHGTLQHRAVTTGRRDEASGRVEVLQGLAPGAQVLAARFDNLREGGKAVVAGTAPMVAEAAAASSNAAR